MKIKLSNKNKAYWINYFYFWLIFISVALVLSNSNQEDGGPPVDLDFKFGFIATSIISVFIFAHVIAKKYRKDQEIDELRIKEGLSYQEFNKKYSHLLEIFDK